MAYHAPKMRLDLTQLRVTIPIDIRAEQYGEVPCRIYGSGRRPGLVRNRYFQHLLWPMSSRVKRRKNCIRATVGADCSARANGHLIMVIQLDAAVRICKKWLRNRTSLVLLSRDPVYGIPITRLPITTARTMSTALSLLSGDPRLPLMPCTCRYCSPAPDPNRREAYRSEK